MKRIAAIMAAAVVMAMLPWTVALATHWKAPPIPAGRGRAAV